MSRHAEHQPHLSPEMAAGQAVVSAMFADGGRVPTTDADTVRSLVADADAALQAQGDPDVHATDEQVLNAISVWQDQALVEQHIRSKKR